MSLLNLPNELRHQIYVSFFSHTYVIYGKQFWQDDRIGNGAYPPAKLEVALLATCKTIHAEAMPILFSRAQFRWSLDFWEKAPLALPRRVTDRMMRVDFIINMSIYGDETRNCLDGSPEDKIPALARNTMKRFTGGRIHRDSCRVKLWGIDYTLDHTPLDQLLVATQRLTGFEEVTTEVEDQNFSCFYGNESTEEDGEEPTESSFSQRIAQPDQGTADSVIQEGSSDFAYMITNASANVYQTLEASLTPTLGPSVSSALESHWPKVYTGLCMIFHPRKHLASLAEKNDEQKCA